MSKTAADLSRSVTTFAVEASDPRLILVTNEDHFLFNTRVNYPVNEELAFSLANGGQTRPITLTKDGETFLVVDGRQEVKAARWIDQLIDANDPRVSFRGGQKMLLNAMVRRFKDAQEAVVFMNRADARIEDTDMAKAERAHHAMKWLAGDKKRVAESMGVGVSVQTLENWLKLLDLDPTVQEAVRSREMPGHVARTMIEGKALPKERQRQVLGEMRSVGATKGAAGKKAIAEAKAGDKITGKPTGKRMFSRPLAEAWVTELIRNQSIRSGSTMHDFVRVILGDKAAEKELQDGWRAALKRARAFVAKGK